MRRWFRPATKQDWPAILKLIRADRNLQQDRLPSWHEFFVFESDGEIHGCCALKIYGKKLAEIRSLAFLTPWLRKLYAKILVRKCINRAKKSGVYQLLATLGKREMRLFESLGFRPFNNQKLAMLKIVRSLKPLATAELTGVTIRYAQTETDRQGIEALVNKYPDELIQPESRLFPALWEFMVALVGGAVVGCCALVVFVLKQNGNPEMAEIRSVAVNPAFERRGIGPQLVLRQMNQAISLRVWELLAVTRLEEWFEKFGFSAMRRAEEPWFIVLNGQRRNGNIDDSDA